MKNIYTSKPKLGPALRILITTYINIHLTILTIFFIKSFFDNIYLFFSLYTINMQVGKSIGCTILTLHKSTIKTFELNIYLLFMIVRLYMYNHN